MEVGYARGSTIGQEVSKDNQIEKIRDEYGDIPMYADIGSGDNSQRDDWLELREKVKSSSVDKVVTTRLDRLGRSVSELSEFLDICVENEVGVHLLEQGMDADPTDKMGFQMLKQLAWVSETELIFIRERRREGIKRAKEAGVQMNGNAPHGMHLDEQGTPQPTLREYERVQQFIEEVQKGRPKRPTARVYDIPEGSINSILDNAARYEMEFDNELRDGIRERVLILWRDPFEIHRHSDFHHSPVPFEIIPGVFCIPEIHCVICPVSLEECVDKW